MRRCPPTPPLLSCGAVPRRPSTRILSEPKRGPPPPLDPGTPRSREAATTTAACGRPGRRRVFAVVVGVGAVGRSKDVGGGSWEGALAPASSSKRRAASGGGGRHEDYRGRLYGGYRQGDSQRSEALWPAGKPGVR